MARGRERHNRSEEKRLLLGLVEDYERLVDQVAKCERNQS